MISNIRNLNPYSYPVSANGLSGKLFVPVNPTAVIYAQFDHISGIAAERTTRSFAFEDSNSQHAD